MQTYTGRVDAAGVELSNASFDSLLSRIFALACLRYTPPISTHLVVGVLHAFLRLSRQTWLELLQQVHTTVFSRYCTPPSSGGTLRGGFLKIPRMWWKRLWTKIGLLWLSSVGKLQCMAKR
ncbi:hypothetical protein GOP47_0000777, partial [Adiantum capillus-veneris]